MKASLQAARCLFVFVHDDIATHHLFEGTPREQVQESLGIKLQRSTDIYVDVAQSLKAQYMQANSL